MKTARLRGIEVAFEEAGAGPPILFVHGHPFSHAMWEGQIRRFGSVARCVAPDLCGYGRTESRPHRVLLDEMALDLLHLLDHLELDRAIVCGLSMGVQIALDLVRLAPARVAGLALAAGSARGETPEGRTRRLRTADQIEAEGSLDGYVDQQLDRFFSSRSLGDLPEAVALLEAMMRRTDAQGAAAALRGRAERRDHRPVLNQIAVPAVVICGDEDAFTSEEEAQELANAIPGARLVWLEGVGHMPNLERPEAFEEALQDLLRRYH
jgi:pimeloyl-ACP methyl ester carboxylesterase